MPNSIKITSFFFLLLFLSARAYLVDYCMDETLPKTVFFVGQNQAKEVITGVVIQVPRMKVQRIYRFVNLAVDDRVEKDFAEWTELYDLTRRYESGLGFIDFNIAYAFTLNDYKNEDTEWSNQPEPVTYLIAENKLDAMAVTFDSERLHSIKSNFSFRLEPFHATLIKDKLNIRGLFDLFPTITTQADNFNVDSIAALPLDVSLREYVGSRFVFVHTTQHNPLTGETWHIRHIIKAEEEVLQNGLVMIKWKFDQLTRFSVMKNRVIAAAPISGYLRAGLPDDKSFHVFGLMEIYDDKTIDEIDVYVKDYYPLFMTIASNISFAAQEGQKYSFKSLFNCAVGRPPASPDNPINPHDELMYGDQQNSGNNNPLSNFFDKFPTRSPEDMKSFHDETQSDDSNTFLFFVLTLIVVGISIVLGVLLYFFEKRKHMKEETIDPTHQ